MERLKDNITDVQEAIAIGRNATFSRVIVRITNSQLSQRESKKSNGNHAVFTRSELLLNAVQWQDNTIFKVNEFGDCDSTDESVLKQSNQNLLQEVDYANHLGNGACILVTLNKSPTTNLARQLMNKFDKSGCVLAEISIVDKSFRTQSYTKNRDAIQLSAASATVWRRWNEFRFAVEFNAHFKVALELTPTELNEGDLNRWCGEPVQMIIIPADLFKRSNKNDKLYLDESIQSICLQFLYKVRPHFAIRCHSDDPSMREYANYIRDILKYSSQSNEKKHECNLIGGTGLIMPKVPADSVNRCTSYQQQMFKRYEQAIRLAIADRLQTHEKIRLMVCGGNSWKLLYQIYSVIEHTKDVEVFVYEEDVNTQLMIIDAIELIYSDKETTIIGGPNDRRYFNQMDIVVSITSQSVFESQWIQLNFESVRNYTRSDAILIPNQSAVSIVPVTAAKAHSYLHTFTMNHNRRETDGLEYYETRAQTVYPLYTRNLYECAMGQDLFSFIYHPSSRVQVSSETRHKKLTFNIDRDCVVTGFCGHFRATLYKDITLNNRAWLNTYNTDCVPMAYFPLKTPSTLGIQDQLKVAFWLIGDIDMKKYWYEWQIINPISIGTHNLNGNSSSFQYVN